MAPPMFLTAALVVMATIRSQVLAAPGAVRIPDYVTKYAPVVYLQSKDPYYPSDIGAQLKHTTPQVDYKDVKGAPSPLTLKNLDSLNKLGGQDVYLTSKDDVSKDSQWLKGVKPDGKGKTKNAVSCVVVVVKKGDDTVDAFYFYFYAYNQGPTILSREYGDHVGDWEHNMIRFKKGKPTAVWFSQHSNGEAYSWDAVEKKGKRVVAYSAKGSHANYATAGKHGEDTTDKGTFWDPISSTYSYEYTDAKKFNAYGKYPVAYLHFEGRWGDKQYKDGEKGQEKTPIVNEYKFVDGPDGPFFKHLDRKNVCLNDGDDCTIKKSLN